MTASRDCRPPERATCETCRWWGAERAHQPEQPYGRCRARSPQAELRYALVLSGNTPMQIPRAQWPWSAFDDWCGEHQGREVADE